MKIIVENGGYGLDNIGDIAMLQVAVSRLKHLWPDAEIFVITADKEKFSFYLSNAYPIYLNDKRVWQSRFNLIGRFHRLFPNKLKDWLARQEEFFKARWPDFSLHLLAWRFGGENSLYLDAKNFVDFVKSADLVVASGGGYVCDAFSQTYQLLDVLLLAQKFNIPTVMLGQGLGPVKNRGLVNKLERVISNLDMISMRERKFSPKVFESVAKNKKHDLPINLVTGDDAIEKAYNLCPEQLGVQLGLNIRDATYSNLPEGTIDKVGQLIRNYVEKNNIDYQLLPISLIKGKSDLEALEKLMHLNPVSTMDENLEVETIIKLVGQCRVVITGSYHAALFALSQGVQVIGLTASKYYDNKFQGLLEQFQTGVQIVYLNEDIDALTQCIESAWEKAEFQRNDLLESAKTQISLGNRAYSYLPEIVLEKKNYDKK